MNTNIRIRIRYAGVFMFICLAACLIFSTRAMATMPPIEFHGYLESNFIARDTNGFQYGFMDKVEGVQQRNTLKFDLDIMPNEPIGGPFTLSKIHLTYRGAYDSIFDLRHDAYKDIRKNSPSRYDLGKDDIHFENDLREASLDITFDDEAGYGFIRPGRQIVSWGETIGFNLLDQFNPSDNSFQMAFTNPDDLKIPLGMVRANYSLPAGETFAFSVDGFFIFEEQPNRLAPLDLSMDAPYAFLFRGLKGLKIREDVPDEKEYGIKLTSEIGGSTSVSLVYFHGAANAPVMVFKDLVGMTPTSLDLVHPITDIYGGFFSSYVQPLDIVLKGEFAWSTNEAVTLNMPDLDMSTGSPRLKAFREKPKASLMLGLDKKIWMRWLTDTSMVNLGFQWIHHQIQDWDAAFETAALENTDLFTFNGSLQAGDNGWINPDFFLAYDMEGTLMTVATVKLDINKSWYVKLSQMSFWGDKEAISDFNGTLISTNEIAFKIGYQW